MNMLIVGSQAISGVLGRSGDFDYWILDSEKDMWSGGDGCIMPDHIMEIACKHSKQFVFKNMYIASPSVILTIKCSHLGWDLFWDKHARDVIHLQSLGYKIIDELFYPLVEYWKDKHGNKGFLSLYKTKSEFFNDYVQYVYDHDYLHELVATPNQPVYKQCLKDGEQVAIDKDKFYQMSHKDQIRMFQEEILVIALERWLIPPNVCGKVSIRDAYRMSLKKTICSLTKNWATEFIIRNLISYWKPPIHELENILNQLPEGEIIMQKRVSEEHIKSELAKVFTEDQVKAIFEEGAWNYWLEDGGHSFYTDYNTEVDILDKLEWIEQDGGGEGGTESCYTVFKLNGVYYQAYYSYYSHYGYEFDSLTYQIVTPVEKTITAWE
jgi:hypothetical protein